MKKAFVASSATLLIAGVGLVSACGNSSTLPTEPNTTVTQTETETATESTSGVAPSPTIDFLTAIGNDLPDYYNHTANAYMLGLAFSSCEEYRNGYSTETIASDLLSDEGLSESDQQTFVSDAIAYCG